MNDRSSTTRKKRPGYDSEPPLYSIDLDLPPESRYIDMCNDYKNEMAELAKIYDEILSMLPFPRFFGFLARNLLKRVYSKEETEEIRAISKVSGVPIYRVVAYNTFLDLFSGCMSGGVQTKMGANTRMLHFRNLDWEMDPLRDMIIRVEYLVNGKIVAR
jgi:beta subunit of N-acylethanolamine-hydrolyzing acid amidase